MLWVGRRCALDNAYTVDVRGCASKPLPEMDIGEGPEGEEPEDTDADADTDADSTRIPTRIRHRH